MATGRAWQKCGQSQQNQQSQINVTHVWGGGESLQNTLHYHCPQNAPDRGQLFSG